MEFINAKNLAVCGAMTQEDGAIVLQDGKLKYMKLKELLSYIASSSIETDKTLKNAGVAADAAAVRNYVDGKEITVTVSLPASSWSDNQQTVNVQYVNDDTCVIVAPDPAAENYTAYTDSGVRCISQGDGTLTFSCDGAPSADLTVNVSVRRDSYDI